ncbi:MAG: 30S ribosomal protein S17 [Candidatus Pacearchaeota archaeon]
MAKLEMEEKTKKPKKTEQKSSEKTNVACADKLCPVHGEISLRGRNFKGTVIRKFPKRITIEFERTLYIKKYERYSKTKTKLHARLPDCMANEINIGDYVEIKECRPISKIIHFMVVRKIMGDKQ